MLSTIVEGIGSIATSLLLIIIGGIATVLIEKIYERLQKPNLSIEFEQKEPFCRIASIQGSGISSYWIRIRVRNKGRRVAKCCVGKLMEIRKIKDEKEEVVTSFDPSALSWVAFKDIEKLAINSRKYGKQYGDEKQHIGWFKKIGTLDINREEYEYLDVVYTRESEDMIDWGNSPGEDSYFHISVTDPTPRGIKTSYDGKGTYILRITIYSENADPCTEEFYLEWNGIWNEIKMNLK